MGKKVVVVGVLGSGKTEMIRRFAKGEYREGLPSTVGSGYVETENVEFWDTAGGARYESLMPMYIKGAHTVIFTLDTTKPLGSEEELNSQAAYLKRMKKLCNQGNRRETREEKLRFILALTKIDDKEKQQDWAKPGGGEGVLKEFAKSLGVDSEHDIHKFSAKTGEDVGDLWEKLSGERQILIKDITDKVIVPLQGEERRLLGIYSELKKPKPAESKEQAVQPSDKNDQDKGEKPTTALLDSTEKGPKQEEIKKKGLGDRLRAFRAKMREKEVANAGRRLEALRSTLIELNAVVIEIENKTLSTRND